VLNQLKDLKADLSLLCVAKVTGGAPNKLSKMSSLSLSLSLSLFLSLSLSLWFYFRKAKSLFLILLLVFFGGFPREYRKVVRLSIA
jgi:hypothetical protein